MFHIKKETLWSLGGSKSSTCLITRLKLCVLMPGCVNPFTGVNTWTWLWNTKTCMKIKRHIKLMECSASSSWYVINTLKWFFLNIEHPASLDWMPPWNKNGITTLSSLPSSPAFFSFFQVFSFLFFLIIWRLFLCPRGSFGKLHI